MTETEARKMLGGESSMDTIEPPDRPERIDQRRKSEAFRKAALDFAIFQYHRMWLNFDGPVQEMIKNSKCGGLDSRTVRLIASEYNIGRTVKLAPDEKKDMTEEEKQELGKLRKVNLKRVCEIFNSSVKPSKDINTRAECTKIISESIHTTITLENCDNASRKKLDENRDKYLPVSYASKLSWFLVPKGWTVFDKCVAKAIGAKGNSETGETSATRMIDYYRRLQCANFQGVVDRVSRDLATAKLSYLPAERIIDMYLWAIGADLEAFKDNWRLAMGHKVVLDPGIKKKLDKARDKLDCIATKGEILPIPPHG